MRKTTFENQSLRYLPNQVEPPLLLLDDVLKILNSNLEVDKAAKILNKEVGRNTAVIEYEKTFINMGGVTYLAIAARTEKARRFNRWYHHLLSPYVSNLFAKTK